MFSPVQRHLKFSQVLGHMSEKSSTTTLPTEEKALLINFLYCYNKLPSLVSALGMST